MFNRLNNIKTVIIIAYALKSVGKWVNIRVSEIKSSNSSIENNHKKCNTIVVKLVTLYNIKRYMLPKTKGCFEIALLDHKLI